MMAIAEILRPAETAIVTDGMTAVLPNPNSPTIALNFGREAANAHQGGGVHVFVIATEGGSRRIPNATN